MTYIQDFSVDEVIMECTECGLFKIAERLEELLKFDVQCPKCKGYEVIRSNIGTNLLASLRQGYNRIPEN